jgi:CubicO group peptidase (beta-lactamase class C family)
VDERTAVHGVVAPGFEGVQRAFQENFDTHGDKGASVAVYVNGAKKVDLWGGIADVATGRPWLEDTVTIVYSATKGATAILSLLLAQRGALELDAPVAEYWPQFARGGKGDVPVRYLLTHEAGLPYLNQRLTRKEVLEGSRIVEILEAQHPIWQPGTAHGYHALTYGWLIGALIAKVMGKRMGEVFAEEIAQPLGLDFHIGLPPSEVSRVAPLVQMPEPDPNVLDGITDPVVRAAFMQTSAAALDPTSAYSRTMSTNGALPTPDAEAWNDPNVYQSEIPAANGISNGRSLATLYAATVSELGGVRLLSDETVARAKVEQVNGPDRTIVLPTRFGTGFQFPVPVVHWALLTLATRSALAMCRTNYCETQTGTKER